jgi:ribosomal-protein-alanine N-acetyltransferase
MAGAADCELMEAIHATAFSAADAWSRDVFGLQLTMPGVIALLHRADGLIVARVAADEAEVLTLAVMPQARRGGAGTALLQRAVQEVAAMGAAAFFLEVSVANKAARALYRRAGFKQAGRRVKYYSDTTDALVLRLDLAGVTRPRRGAAEGC